MLLLCGLFILLIRLGQSQWQEPLTPYPQQIHGNQRGVINSVLSPQNVRPGGAWLEANWITLSNGFTANGGVQIQFQLRGYSNPGLQLPGGNTCVCPQGQECSYVNKRMMPECYFAFTFIISAPDQSVRYFATPFITLDSGGNLRSDGERWNEDYVVQLPSKPSAIDVFVHHMGMVIKASDASMVATETLTHVDTFVVPLNEELPSVGRVGAVPTPRTFSGTILNTQLSLAVSIACLGDMIGMNCDLVCTESPVAAQKMACRQNSTGFHYVCNRAAINGQVDACQSCPWGIREETYCQDENGGVMNPSHAGVVDDSWKVAALSLAVATLIIFVLFVVALIFACKACRKQRRYDDDDDDVVPGHNYQQALHRAAEQQPASRPLLDAAKMPAGSAASTPMSGPTAAPRSTPNLEARPQKSALRVKAPLVPPAHLGGSNSINDTLNSSFASEVPMRPSRSEVV